MVFPSVFVEFEDRKCHGSDWIFEQFVRHNMKPMSEVQRSGTVERNKVGIRKKRKRVLLQVPENIAKLLNEPGADLRVKVCFKSNFCTSVVYVCF